MNVQEINPGAIGTLAHYVETTIPLTLVTMWLVVAMQGRWDDIDEKGNQRGSPSSLRRLVRRLGWPAMLMQRFIESRKQKEQRPQEGLLLRYQA
jgi:hypothetical protein